MQSFLFNLFLFGASDYTPSNFNSDDFNPTVHSHGLQLIPFAVFSLCILKMSSGEHLFAGCSRVSHQCQLKSPDSTGRECCDDQTGAGIKSNHHDCFIFQTEWHHWPDIESYAKDTAIEHEIQDQELAIHCGLCGNDTIT